MESFTSPDSSSLEFSTWFIKLRVLKKVLGKIFCFIRCRRQHLRSVEYRSFSRFTFVGNTISNLPKVPRSKFLGSDQLFYFISICSLAASRTLLQRLLASLNFALDWVDLFCWYIWKKWFMWTIAAAQAAENHADEWGLAWYLRQGIYASILTWIHSQNSLAVAEGLSLKMSSHGTSLK